MEDAELTKLLSISRNGVELASSRVNHAIATIGRSPTCDIVLRARGVRPVHFLMEWYGGFPVGGPDGKWSIIEVPEKKDLTSEEVEDFGLGKILGEGMNRINGFEFQWKVDKLAPSNFTGALTDSIEEHSQSIGYSDLLEILEVDLTRDSVCHVQHIGTFDDKRTYELRPGGPEISFVWVTGTPMVRGKILFRADEDLKVIKVGGKLNQMGSGEIHMSANDVLCVTWRNYQYYIRFVAAMDLPEIKESPLAEPIYKFGGIFLGVVILIMGLFMLIYNYEPPAPPKVHTRVAKIEIDKLMKPVVIEKKEAPKDFQEDYSGERGEDDKKSEPVPLPESKVTTSPQVETPKPVVESSPEPPAPEPPPTPEPPPLKAEPPTPPQAVNAAPVEDVSNVGLLGLLGAPANNQANISTESLLSETQESEGAFNEGEGVPFVRSGKLGRLDPANKVSAIDLSKAATKIDGSVDPSALGGRISNQKALNTKGGKNFGKSRVASRVTSAYAVSGGLNKGAVKNIVNKNLAKMKECYEKALISKPDLQGKVTYFWVVSKSGKVESAQLKESEANHKQFEDCTLKVIEKLKFPASGAPTEVVYPFVFK